MHSQESCGCFLFCLSRGSKHQDLSEWSDLTASDRLCCFSKVENLCCVLFRYSGEKQRSPPLNLTGTCDVSVLGTGSFYSEETVCLLYVTYPSCFPWSLSREPGCMGRTLLCFCVSSGTPFPPGLDSVCDNLSHSLRENQRRSVCGFSPLSLTNPSTFTLRGRRMLNVVGKG